VSKKPAVYAWEDIRDKGWKSLVLGNGASIAVDERFAYDALLTRARAEGLVTDSVEQVFKYLKTKDFELVMSMLWHTHHINTALSIEDTVSRRAYDDIKEALIQTVKANHPEHDAIAPHLEHAYRFMSNFKSVISLNYDLVVYWALLHGNEAMGKRRFKDCFTGPDLTFDPDWRRLYEPYGTSATTLVFYPHGNLALAADLGGVAHKISKDGSAGGLLDTVVNSWETGKTVPLFVSEGSSEQKLAAIQRSDYLGRVYAEVLAGVGSSLVVYGWAMSDSDAHLLRKLCASQLSDVAVSVRNDGDVGRKCESFRERIRAWNADVTIWFFDAASPGSWATPE
jgi:hypothetical protein